MSDEKTVTQEPPTAGKGKAFFDRGDQVAETGNWDFAIEMYLEGLRREPGNVDRGHEPLRQTALKRKASGGKGPGLMEQLKFRPSKDPLETLLNAERLLGKDPGSVAAMENTLKAAIALDLPDVVRWIGNMILHAQRQAAKPNKRALVHLAEALGKIHDFPPAILAAELAHKVDPADGSVSRLWNDLSANYTLERGHYNEENTSGDFTQNVVDMDEQKRLAQADALVKDQAYLLAQIEKTKTEYHQSLTVPGKINGVVDALLKFEDDKYENEAVDILTQAHHDLGAYQFKMRIGDIRIRQMTRRYRELAGGGDKAAMAAQAKRQLAFELQEYTERSANYPTDLEIKYELGRRQLLAGRLDDAISSFQHAQRSPRRRLAALSYLGQTFAKKGMLREAVDTFEKALEGDVVEERAKDLRYRLGCVLSDMGDLKKAEDQFSQVAQMDYNFLDVRERLEKVRKKLEGM